MPYAVDGRVFRYSEWIFDRLGFFALGLLLVQLRRRVRFGKTDNCSKISFCRVNKQLFSTFLWEFIIPYYLSSKLLCFPSPRSSSPLSGVDDRAANMEAAEAPVAVFRLLDNMFWSFVANPTVAVSDWTS